MAKTYKTYIKEVEKKGTITTNLQQGTAKIKINNIKNTNQSIIDASQRLLLKTLVRDEDIIKIMAQEENLKKMRHRFENKLEVIGTDNQTLITASKFNMTPKETIQLANKLIATLEDTEKQYTINKLKEKGWTNINERNKGQVKQLNLIVILRKG